MKKKSIIIAISIIAFIICLILFALIWYNTGISAPDKKNQEKNIDIKSGMSTEEILELLKENEIIKNKLAAKIFIKINGVNGLQAGKYKLNTSMNLEEVLNQIATGKVTDESITITFLEGKNMRWIAKKIAEKTNNTEESVYELLDDKNFVDSLINEYWFLNDDILDEDIYYSLEGYLYPETYNFENKDVSVQDIFRVLLNQTDKVLADYRNQIEERKISVHQLLTVASIIELEGKDEESRKGISSVIYNRLKNKMSIGSDVTTYYAIKVDMGERDLYAREINEYNPYNTRGPNMLGKLPVGPIATVSEQSIDAALNPASTEYLYFVADINGKIHFSGTYEEHLQLIQKLKNQGLWYVY